VIRIARLATILAVVAAAAPLGPNEDSRQAGAQSCNVQISLDNPAENETVLPSQTVSGWAADQGATDGTGINAVVVTLDGALDSPDNRLIGVADYGSPRPDIAESLGERFTNVGFSVTWDTSTVPSGRHQLFVQTHTACGWETLSRPIVVQGTGSAAVAPTSGVAPVAAAASTPSPTVLAAAASAATSSVAAAARTPTVPVPAAAAGTPATASAASGPAVVTPGAIPVLPTSSAVKPPENLRLLAATTNSVTLAWNPPQGESPQGYVIYQATIGADGNSSPGGAVARLPAGTTSATISGLQDPSKYTYYFTIASINAAGNSTSPLSTAFVSTTPPGTRVALPPTPLAGTPATSAAPAAVAAGTGTPGVAAAAAVGTPTAAAGANGAFTATAAVNGTSVNLSWTAQPGAASYNVYGASLEAINPTAQDPALAGAPGAQPGPPNPLLGGVPPGAPMGPPGAPPGLPPGLPGRPPGFPPGVPPGAPPGMPLGVPPNGAPPGSNPLLASNRGPALTGPLNPLASSTPGTWMAVLQRVTTTSGTVPNLLPGGDYSFVVRSVNSGGQEYNQSAPVEVSIPLTPVAATVAGSAGAVGSTGPGTSPGSPPAAAAPGSTPGPAPAAGTPGFNLTAATTGPTSVQLNWSASSAAATYSVLVGRANGPMVPDPARSSLSTTSAQIDGLPVGSQFTFQIAAKDAAGTEVARSNPASVTITPPGAPGPTGAGSFPLAPTYVPTPVATPVGASNVYPPPPGTAGAPGSAPTAGGAQPTPGFTLTSNPADPGSANLQWTPLSNAAYYAVWSGPAGGPLQVSVPNTTNAAAFIPNLPGGQYTFQIRARDASGTEVAVSNPITVVVQPH